MKEFMYNPKVRFIQLITEIFQKNTYFRQAEDRKKTSFKILPFWSFVVIVVQTVKLASVCLTYVYF